MKITQILYKQHIGWHFKRYWAVQSKRKIVDTNAEQLLKEKGIVVQKSEDILKEKFEPLKLNIVGYKTPPVAYDKTHSNWHDRTLLTYKDDNVLLEGLTQAKILTNTVEVKQGLPYDVTSINTKKIDSRVQDILMSCFVFDAEQKKLPKIKDPARPAFNFPRIYGITEERAVKLLLTNILHLLETTSQADIARERYLLNDLSFSYNFEYFKDLIQFQLRGDTVLVSATPLSPVTAEPTDSYALPDIFPIKPTITLKKENIYETTNTYPVNLQRQKCHPHTVFIHQNGAELKNLFEEEVTDNQIYGRSLLKTFTVAASYAKQKYGDVQNLPEPVTVQCVQTNGRLFHFGIFQLNTLDLESKLVKNVWYHIPHVALFEECCYKQGRPLLNGYNDQVVKHLSVFYNKR